MSSSISRFSRIKSFKKYFPKDKSFQCRIKLNIKQSFVQETQQMSTLMLRNHNAMSFRLGEAIEFEFVDEDNHLRCNRNCMKQRSSSDSFVTFQNQCAKLKLDQ